uniref:Stromal interaction molecule 2 n=1 Tax=Poecilia latipinna TaxID=48699 RepID=A0A3B3UVF3_9TELE
MQTSSSAGLCTHHRNAIAHHRRSHSSEMPVSSMTKGSELFLEALRSIHQMMDDDQDGGIEVEESMEFIIEDMKQQQTHKHSNLHREDQHITVEELWRGWKSSEVHNWTLDDVLRWLKDFVELPQYERNFKDFRVNGNTLPRIAANEPSFLSSQLKVLDQRDKQKLNIKALDVVLFGPPTRPPHNYMKDLLLIVSVVMGVGGCWFAQAQNKASKVHVTKMMKDLESLQRAEQSLMDLQEQLERAQEEKRNVAVEKQCLEEKMRDEIIGAQEEAHRLHELRQGAVSELSRLRYAEEELEQVRGALKQAEKEMIASWTVSGALQQWLQLTYEVEVQYYNVKKHSAELQLAAAKEEAERIKKKRSSVLGTLHMAHSSSLDQVDHKIMEAKHALSEVTACLRERLHRWQHIEFLCGFPIMRNPGLANLSAQLYSDTTALGFPRVSQSDIMGSSINVASRKKGRDDAELLIESRRVTRNSVGMSQDAAFRKLPLNMGDFQLESSLMAVPKDKIDETAVIPQRKISREELEYCSDPASVKMPHREPMDAFRDAPIFKDTPEIGLESAQSRRILRNEAEMSAGSLRRRIPGLSRSNTSSTDSFSENISWDRVNASVDMSKHLTLRDDLGGFESSSLPCRVGQPDLMLTSQVPRQSSSDLCTAGPLSQLVYDGILEKSCSSMSSVHTPLSASTPNLPQSRLLAELELPLPPPQAVCPTIASPSESGDEKNKEKDKSKKTLKLKNLFKKKNESTPEKSHSGLQKL